MYISVVLVSLAALASCAWLWLRGRRARALLAPLPTYPTLPLIGNVHKLYGGGEVLFQRVKEMSDISEQTDLPFLIWIGPCPALLFIHPEDVKVVTNAFVEKPYYYNFGRIWLGDGLVTASVPIWKRSIKKLAGTFNSTVVDGYQAVFNAQARKLVDELRRLAGQGQEPSNIMPILAQTTLETICQTALGVPKISESIVTSEYYEAFNRALELLINRGLNLAMHSDFIYKLTPAHREMEKCIAIVHNVSRTVITKRKKEWSEKRTQNYQDQIKTESSSTKFKSFLDILLELSESDPTLTAEQIKAEVDTIILGGQETVATTMFYTLLVVGSRPDVQDKMYAELREIFGDSNRSVEKEDLTRMQYCEAVIYETLRLYPPVPVVMRFADKDLQLRSFVVPQGTGCGINMFGAGRSRRAWGPDALQYRPERWLESDLVHTHAATFLAFSYGRRACIGKKYAIAILKTVLAYCIRELRFSSDISNLKLKVDLAMRPVSGHLIQVFDRHPQAQVA